MNEPEANTGPSVGPISGPSDPATEKLRQRIAREAARLVGEGQDSHRARLRAARRVAGRFVPEGDLPRHESILAEAASILAEAGQRDISGSGGSASSARHLGDRFDRIAEFVRVLVNVRQDPAKHPEGDALEHSLQVFDLVERERPYDEELLTAALVHDVGRAIDRRDPVAACLHAMADLVTDRTKWFVEQLPAARQLHVGTLGARGRRRLEANDDFEDLLILEEADRKGRIRGYDAPPLENCIAALRRLAQE